MNYVSFDIETTGLDPHSCDILEAAFVVDGEDFYNTPLRLLPWNSMLIVKEDYAGVSPFAAMMHARNGLWQDIINAYKHVNGEELFDLNAGHKPARDSAFKAVHGLFAQVGSIVGTKVILAGKNVATFDLPFLHAHGIINYNFEFEGKECQDMKIAKRVLDVGPMFMQRGLDHVPSTKECCELAGIPEVSSNHRAYGDCILVAALLRKKLLGKLSNDDLDFLRELSN